MNWNDPTPTPVLADIIYAGAGGHHLRQRAREELVGCIEMGCIEICSSKSSTRSYANEHGKNSWDVLKWDVLKSVGRKYEKGKLVKYKSACLCTIEHPINELVRSNTTSALLDVEGEGKPTEYVLVLADIIKANDPDRTGKDAYRSARHKYEKGKLDKYKSACLCDLENPTNNLVSVLELW